MSDPSATSASKTPGSGPSRSAFLVSLLLGLTLFVLGGLAVIRYLGPSPAPERVTLAVGDALPGFELPSLAGDAMSKADLAALDGPVILNFWATWCQPCLYEIPSLRRLHEIGAAEVVSVALDDGGADVVRPFVEEQGIEYPVLLGNSQLLYERFDSTSIPFTLVLDDELRIRSIHRAVVTERTLQKDLAEARTPWREEADEAGESAG